MEQICDLLLPLSTMEPGDDLLLVFIYNLGEETHLVKMISLKIQFVFKKSDNFKHGDWTSNRIEMNSASSYTVLLLAGVVCDWNSLKAPPV